MNKVCLFLQLFITITSFAQQRSFKITNSTNIDFEKSIITLPWKQILAKYPSIDSSNFKVINKVTKKEIPYQLEYLSLPAVQNLLLQVSVAAKSSLSVAIVKGKPKPVKPATYGRYVPERKEDFAWENDKIAFRMYGKELEKTPSEMAYGIDVWVKRTNRLIINERYKRGEYHIDHGDGLDYYHVGLTLGAGNAMPFLNDTIYYSKNYTSFSVLDNGPLRTTFQLFYDAWLVNGIITKAVKTISLDAGSQLNKIAIQYNAHEILPVAVGIVLREDFGIKYLNEQNGILAYWEPNSEMHGTTAVGCILPQLKVKMEENAKQIIAKAKCDTSNLFTYYSGAAWNKAGEIKTMNDWLNYLQVKQEQLLHPLTVSF